MPEENVLINVVTAANLAGVEEAKASFLGLSASTLGLAAILFAVVEIGKAAEENYQKQQEALLGLKQATDATGLSYELQRRTVEAFIETNKAYISNQYDVITAYANLIRAGNNSLDAQRLLNDALDLSVIKHEHVTDAAKALILAENGTAKALRDLGISSAEYNAIMKDHIVTETILVNGKKEHIKVNTNRLTQEQRDAELLTLIETKTKDGRKATDDLQQSQNKLNTDWQNFTTTIGPGVSTTLDTIYKAADAVVNKLDDGYQALQKFGSDPHSMDGLNNALIDVALKIQEIVHWIQQADAAMRSLAGDTAGGNPSNPATYTRQ